MSTTINKINNEVWCTKAQYETRKAAGTLVVGCLYHITDDDYALQILIGTTDPTTSTTGSVGQFYLNTTNNKTFICTAATTTYTWITVAPVQDVQMNSTSILSNGVADIPIATDSSLGVVKGGGLGIKVYQGLLYSDAAGETQIIAKTSAYQPIACAKLDIAIREGLGNNSLTWTDQYKQSARTTIGAGHIIEIEELV